MSILEEFDLADKKIELTTLGPNSPLVKCLSRSEIDLLDDSNVQLRNKLYSSQVSFGKFKFFKKLLLFFYLFRMQLAAHRIRFILRN